MYPNAPERRPLRSFADMQIGARLSLPILPAVTTFGLAVGAAAAAKGLSLLHSVMMNALIFALQRIDGYQSICRRVMS